jgi:hypothetical protein
MQMQKMECACEDYPHLRRPAMNRARTSEMPAGSDFTRTAHKAVKFFSRLGKLAYSDHRACRFNHRNQNQV